MSICKGIDGIIDQHLGVTDVGKSPHYDHKTSCLRLRAKPPQLNPEHMIEAMLSCIESNWRESPRRQYAGPSLENWRFEKKMNMADHNVSIETTLERTIAKTTNHDWVNQVPTASGLWDGSSDKHRNIDLVHRLGPKQYEFIELKVESDTPLKAAVESLIYGVLYISARLQYPAEYRQTRSLLQAEEIHLCVLAPRSYYDRYHLKWLVPEFNTGLQSVLMKRSLNLKMSFRFDAFPSDFVWRCEDKYLGTALDAIAPVTWD